MRQSTAVILLLFFAFVVFVTMRGELPLYLGLLGLGRSSGSATGTAAVAGGAGSTTPAGFLSQASSTLQSGSNLVAQFNQLAGIGTSSGGDVGSIGSGGDTVSLLTAGLIPAQDFSGGDTSDVFKLLTATPLGNA